MEAPDQDPPESKPGIRGRLPDITWNLKRTIWGLIFGLIAGLFAPLLVLPFDPSLDSDGAMLAAQGLFGLCLIGVPWVEILYQLGLLMHAKTVLVVVFDDLIDLILLLREVSDEGSLREPVQAVLG